MHKLFSLRVGYSFAILMVVFSFAMPGAKGGTLSVGAAKVDITPPADAALPMSGYAGRKQGFQGIHDHIYVRAIVLSDGTQDAAILSWELIAMPTPVWQLLSQRISRQLGIPVDNILLVGEHVHAAPSIGTFSKPIPATIAYTKTVGDKAFEAIHEAKATLQPATFGFGTGECYVNINRREYFPREGWWGLGYNPQGPSDKTVSVLKFENLSGRPIALFINYAVHSTVMGPHNLEVSGDLAGATSRFVERFYDGNFKQDRSDEGWELQPEQQATAGKNGVVALFTPGAAGDQNPIVSDSDEDFSMVNALGRILGEETVRVAQNITAMSTYAELWADQQVITCPGQKVALGPEPRRHYTFLNAPPVNIRLSLLRLNKVALAGVSGEVLTPIFYHLLRESPFKDVIMVAYANGYSGYIPNDAAYNQISYEITATHLKPGCAENGIVNGLVALMRQHN
jgi:neutral ceramidase